MLVSYIYARTLRSIFQADIIENCIKIYRRVYPVMQIFLTNVVKYENKPHSRILGFPDRSHL